MKEKVSRPVLLAVTCSVEPKMMECRVDPNTMQSKRPLAATMVPAKAW